MFKVILACAIFLIVDANASTIAKRDVQQSSQPQLLNDLQKNMDMFRNCVDQSLASVVGQVNEKQLQPILSVVGDTVNRVSKAFEDLTATTKPTFRN